MEYEVKREHLGDKPYMPGDKREAAPSDVAHLVRAGVLVEAKVEPALEVKNEATSAAEVVLDAALYAIEKPEPKVKARK